MKPYDEPPWWCPLLWPWFGPPWYEQVENLDAYLAAFRRALIQLLCGLHGSRPKSGRRGGGSSPALAGISRAVATA